MCCIPLNAFYLKISTQNIYKKTFDNKMKNFLKKTVRNLWKYIN